MLYDKLRWLPRRVFTLFWVERGVGLVRPSPKETFFYQKTILPFVDIWRTDNHLLASKAQARTPDVTDHSIQGQTAHPIKPKQPQILLEFNSSLQL